MRLYRYFMFFYSVLFRSIFDERRADLVKKFLRNGEVWPAEFLLKTLQVDPESCTPYRMGVCSLLLQKGDIIAGSKELGDVGFDGNLFKSGVRRNRIEDNSSFALVSFDEKKVAVVGPCMTGSDNLEEHANNIERNDFVFRVGYAGKESVAEGTGSRCDGSFYAGHKIDKLISEGKSYIFSDLKICIVKSGKDKDRIEKANPHAVVFVSNEGFGAFVLNKADAGASLVSDVLGWGCSSLEIYNFDLFVTTEYPKGYIANDRKPRKKNSVTGLASEKRSAFVSHNPFAHFRFFEFVREEFGVAFDDKLNFLIDSGLSSYANRLEELYGRD